MGYKASFRFGGDVIEAIYSEQGLMFLDTSSGAITNIDGLKINKQGAIKEFPDLKDNKEWRKETVKRFKEHIKKMKTKEQVIDYVIEELKKYGYDPQYKQRIGHRPKKIK